jgi:hypothetical protein
MKKEYSYKLYKLELHEGYLDIDLGIYIIRVPGGWIYDCWDVEKDQFKQGMFIAFNKDME